MYSLENGVSQPLSPVRATAGETLTSKENHLVRYVGGSVELVDEVHDRVDALVINGAASGSGVDVRPWAPGVEYKVRVSAAVARDAALQIDASNPGQLVTATTGPIVAVAREATSGAGNCLVAAQGNTSPEVFPIPGANAENTTATLTAAESAPNAIHTSTTAAAVALTLPTGALMDDTWELLVPIGHGFRQTFINTGGSNAITVTAASGFTLVGSATVAASTSATYLYKRTAADTWVAYRE